MAMEKLGKYQIVEKIGVGGFGVVYKGYDPFIKRHVAIKTCSVEDKETRERFHREAEISGNLQHRNIVTVFEFGFDQEVPFLVQEYLSGEDLDRKIKRNEYVPLPEKILWLVQIARGLEFAHSRNIIHRDIKPANVRILDDGTAKILDFGIAKLAHQTSHLTQAGITLGTAAYLAPEQVRGEPIDPRTDVFSFGVLAYELLAYERPFRSAEISAIFYKILNEIPESLTVRVPDLPAELDRIVSRCLEKDRTKRWRPTIDLVQALEGMMQRRPGATTLEGARTVITPRHTEGRTAIVERTRSTQPPANRPNFDELEFHHSEAGPRVQSRSMATTAFGSGRPRGWGKWLGVAGIAAALAVGAVFLGRGTRSTEGGPEAEPSDSRAASGPAIVPAPLAPVPLPAAPTPEPTPIPEPDPGRVVVGPAWEPAMQVRVGGKRLRLDREHRIELPPGSHSLVFSLETPAYSFTETRKVRLDAGATARVAVPIEKPGRLTVQPQLNSRTGTVRIDGKMAGNAPLRGRWLAPGEHFVEVFPASGVTAAPALSRNVTIRSDIETVLTFDLDRGSDAQVRERPSAAPGAPPANR